MEKRIYVADDEEHIRLLIKGFLENEGFLVETFTDGKTLLEAFSKEPADMVILDVMMPGMDGFTVCRQLRKDSTVPIIIVSAKDQPLDRITGLTLGSDDYLAKPFLPLELVARVKAMFRRQEFLKQQESSDAPEEKELCFGDLWLNGKLRTILLNGESFPATPSEFDFLYYMMKHGDRAVSREELFKEVWHAQSAEMDSRAADDLVKRFRKKLKERGSRVRIETVWGFGFYLSEEEKTS